MITLTLALSHQGRGENIRVTVKGEGRIFE
jgi:hypothetical protein